MKGGRMKIKKHIYIPSLLLCLLIFGTGRAVLGQDSLVKDMLKSFEYRLSALLDRAHAS